MREIINMFLLKNSLEEPPSDVIEKARKEIRSLSKNNATYKRGLALFSNEIKRLNTENNWDVPLPSKPVIASDNDRFRNRQHFQSTTTSQDEFEEAINHIQKIINKSDYDSDKVLFNIIQIFFPLVTGCNNITASDIVNDYKSSFCRNGVYCIELIGGRLIHVDVICFLAVQKIKIVDQKCITNPVRRLLHSSKSAISSTNEKLIFQPGYLPFIKAGHTKTINFDVRALENRKPGSEVFHTVKADKLPVNCTSPKSGMKYYKYLIKCLKTKNSRNNVVSKMNEYAFELDFREVVLKDWVTKKLGKDTNLKISSICTYLGKAGRTWLICTEGLNLLEYDDEEWLELYHSTISELDKRYSSPKPYHVIGELFNIASKYIGLTELEPVAGNNGGMAVSPLIVSEKNFVDTITRIKNRSDFTVHEKQNYICIAILMYRLGLRVSEAAKLSTKEVCLLDHKVERIYISSNKFGGNKTPSSTRSMQVGAIFTEEEHEILSKMFRNASLKNPGKNNPIFTREKYSEHIVDSIKTSHSIGQALREITGHKALRLHHLRHTALNRLFLQAHGIQMEGITYGKTRDSSIRQEFFGCRRDNVIHTLSKFAGHGSPEVTLKHYIHVTDYINGHFINNSNLTIPMEIIYAVSPTGAKGMAQALNKISPNISKKKEIPLHILAKAFSEKHQLAQCISSESITAPETEFICDTSYLSIVKTLTYHDAGDGVNCISIKMGLNEEIIERYIVAATVLSSLKTQKGSYRLISTSRYININADKKPISPPLPTSPNIQQDTSALFDKIIHEYEQSPLPILKLITNVINLSNTNNAYIAIPPEDLQSNLSLILRLLPSRRIKLTFKPTYKKMIHAVTKKLSNSITLNSQVTAKSAICLYISSTTEVQILSRKHRSGVSYSQYSSPVLKHCCHSLAIKLYSEGLLAVTDNQLHVV